MVNSVIKDKNADPSFSWQVSKQGAVVGPVSKVAFFDCTVT